MRQVGGRLEVHLTPFLKETLLDRIKADSIDRYKAEILRSGHAGNACVRQGQDGGAA
jgi:hypothetical protein